MSNSRKIARVELLGLADRVGRFGCQPYSEAGRHMCDARSGGEELSMTGNAISP